MLPIALFFLLFDVYLGQSFGVGVFFAFIILSGRIIYEARCNITNDYKLFLILIGMVILYCGLIGFIGGDFSVFRSFIKVAFGVSTMYFLIMLYSAEKIIRSVASVGIFQFSYILVCIINPDFYELGSIFRPGLDSHIYSSVEQEGTFVRTFPASGQLLSGLAVVAGFIASAIGVYWISSQRGSVLLLLGFISWVMIGAVSGRTSFVIVFIVFISFLLLTTSKYKLKMGAVGLGAGISLLTVFAFALMEYNWRIYEWVYEPLINFANGDGFRTASTDSLISDHFSALSFESFLQPGLLYRSSGGWSAGSDVGYIRYLYFGGLPFLILLLLLVGAISRLFFTSGNFRSMITPVFVLLVVTLKQETFNNASLMIAFSILVLVYSRVFSGRSVLGN